MYTANKIGNQLGTVYQNVEDTGHDKGGGHIKGGVLFDKHG